VSDRLRASDRDREQAVEALREAAGEGRLTVDELDERVALAYRARTRGDLVELLDDVLVPATPEPAAPARRLPWLPGRAPFEARWTFEESPGAAVAEFMEAAAAPLHAFGYELVERGRDRLVFAQSRRPGWTIAVAVLLFPFGLFALVHTVDEIITVDFVRTAGRTVGLAQGVAPLPVRRAFAQLED
jgi:Domain of unknown function (DUF1707)